MAENESFLGRLLLRFFAHFCYILGLSVIIPLVFLFFLPEKLWTPVVYAKPVFYVAVFLVIFSAVILYFLKGSVGKAFFSLGLMTFIPGTLSLLFSIYNEEIVFGVIKQYVAQFDLVQPLVESYLEHIIPAVWGITVAYLGIGILLLWVGVTFLRKEFANSWFKEAFGYRP